VACTPTHPIYIETALFNAEQCSKKKCTCANPRVRRSEDGITRVIRFLKCIYCLKRASR
jgi:hypothetical protein